MKRVTLDTNVLPPDDILKAAEGLGFEFALVSVSNREVAGTDIEVELKKINTITETAVWGESKWGQALWGPVVSETFILGESRLGGGLLGDDKEADVFEIALKIISNGGFPKRTERENLTAPQRCQLRDAMILAAHVREKRDIFVTNDKKGFIDNGRRETIKKDFGTKILTQSEFIEYCHILKEKAPT